MVESTHRRFDSMSLSCLKVFPEVLVSAPPVGPDHVQPLVPQLLMEVGVTNIVLLTIHRETSITMGSIILLVYHTNGVIPLA